MIFKNTSHLQSTLALGLLTLLPGCKDVAKLRPHIRPLTALIDYYDSSQGVTLRVKKLDAHDCESLLGKNSQRLFKKIRKSQPMWPIQVSLTNETNKLISLKTTDISLPQVPYRKVATRLHRNSISQVIGTLVSGFLIGGCLVVASGIALSASGIVLLTTGSLSVTAPLAIIGSTALAAVPAFLIVGTPILSTIRGVETAKNNQAITRDIRHHSINSRLIVEPHSTKDAIIFVSKPDYSPTFTVQVTSPNNAREKITFHVSIPDSEFAIGRS